MQESPTRRQHPSTSSLTEGKPPLKKLQLGDVDASNLTQSAALPTSLPSASTEPVEDGSGMDAMERSAEEWEQQNRNFRMKTFADDLRNTPQRAGGQTSVHRLDLHVRHGGGERGSGARTSIVASGPMAQAAASPGQDAAVGQPVRYGCSCVSCCPPCWRQFVVRRQRRQSRRPRGDAEPAGGTNGGDI